MVRAFDGVEFCGHWFKSLEVMVLARAYGIASRSVENGIDLSAKEKMAMAILRAGRQRVLDGCGLVTASDARAVAVVAVSALSPKTKH